MMFILIAYFAAKMTTFKFCAEAMAKRCKIKKKKFELSKYLILKSIEAYLLLLLILIVTQCTIFLYES